MMQISLHQSLIKESREVMLLFSHLISSKAAGSQAHSTHNHRSHDAGSNTVCSSWKGFDRRLSRWPVSTGQYARGKSRQARSRTCDTSWSRLDRCRLTSRKIYLWGTSGPGFHILRRELDLGNGDLSGENRGRGRRRDGLTG